MPFLRPGHVVNTLSSARFGLLTLFSISAAHSAHARPFKPVGVQAWTSGSQTFIRARPGASVPPVAKVARHTPLYVWGKYNGWYRVETHDHIFGWVFNPYLNSPDLAKVREMPRSKAQIASDRTANQTMYGTPDVLKKHFATYRAKGALVGLQKQGVYIAAAPKSSRPKTLITKAPKAAVKTSVQGPKARLASAPLVRNRVLIAEPVPRAFTPRRELTSVENLSPIPTVETSALAPRTASLSSQFGGSVEAPPAPRAIEAQKIAGVSRTLSPSARRLARAAEIASRPSAPVAVAPKTIAPVVATIAPVAPRVVAAPKVAAKKPVAKVAPRRRVSWKERRRQQLRANMGLSPAAVPATVIAPVSPAELMKAREEYLNARKARFGSPSPAQQLPAETPVIGLAPLPSPSGPLGGTPQGFLAPAAPGRLAPSSFKGQAQQLPPLASDHPLTALINDPRVIALAQLTPGSASTAPKAQTKIAARGGSPRDRAAAMRGGSPRDRFGSGMANQALSYRGMPYIRGAASPKRGFDCSGLVYFLLRQRGYNPPRTAAGYRNWGQSVPRGGLQAGDLVLFANTYKRGISHIGVYMGEGKFVHAATSGTGVRVSSLNERYYAGKYYGARRVK
jgi:cell wall-associated NlpC family hydrolase